MIARWWWLVLACGLIVMGAAYLLVGRSSGVRYEGKTRLHVVNTVVSYNPRGEPIAATVVPRTTNEVNPVDFLVAQVAERAAAQGGVDIGSRRLLAKLVVVPLSPTDVELRYTSPSRPESARALAAYAAEYVEWKRAQQERGLSSALASLQKTLKDVRKTLRSLRAEESDEGSPSATVTAYEARGLEVESGIDMLNLAIRLIPEQVAVIGDVEVASSRVSLPTWLAAAGGLAAGLVGGVLLILLVTRSDPRVRRSSDLQLGGIRVIDGAQNRRSEAMQHLRSELELAGLGRDVHVLIVTSPTRAENRAGIASELAQTFAETEVPTVLVSGDLGSHGEETAVASPSEDGVAAFLEGRLASLPLVELGENLAWVPRGGASEVDPVMFTADRVERVLSEARKIGRVVILDGPPLEHPSGLLVAASGDLTLVIVQRGKTRWTQLAQSLELVSGAVRRPVQVFFDAAARRPRRQEEVKEAAFGHDLSTATSAQA
jgi:Mrp family chromosome partitioning ATPase